MTSRVLMAFFSIRRYQLSPPSFTLCIFTLLLNSRVDVSATSESLDPQGKYLLSWHMTNGKITFELEVETKGYIGLGISPSGNMIGADIFIGGVGPDGNPYSHDMHGVRNGAPVKDNHSDWTLLSAKEDATKTYLKVSRALVTCDEQDYPIGNDTVRIIWSMGATDAVAYHGATNRGTKSANLMLPDEDKDFKSDEYFKWDIESEIEMPPDDTTYWCTFHKAPLLTQKHHIVSFQPLFTNSYAATYTHHFIIYRCEAPSGQDPDNVFGKFVGDPGEHCYSPTPRLPVNRCLGRYMYAWSKGGKGMIFPPDLGHPFPEVIGKNNYLMLEVHYDNPETLAGLRFKTGGRVLYTDKLRKIEAGLLTLGHRLWVSMTIPPNQAAFTVSGHCGSDCTSAILPSEGIKVFNSLLHSHLSGRRLKVRQIRGRMELPWLDYDENYDFNFQQNKPLLKFVDVRQGDHLTVECVYNTQWNPNKVVVAGLSTREEMCMAFLWYFPLQPKILDYCGSSLSLGAHFDQLGITNYTRTRPPQGGLLKYTIVEPSHLAGEYETIMSSRFKWNASFIAEYEKLHRFGKHVPSCGIMAATSGDVQFPQGFVEYKPEDICTK